MKKSDIEEVFLGLNEGYNQWSKIYDHDDIPLNILEESVVDRALGEVRGLRILDLGCGTGRQTLRLAHRGARVTGVDQSEGMLAKARTKTGEADWIHANLDQAFPFDDASFDRVVSFLALEHISNLKHFFSECARVQRKDGFIYMTAMHPAMVLRGVQARFTDETGRKIYPQSYKYQISDYVNAAISAGLRLRELTEHAPDSSHAQISERAQKYAGWPLLLTLRLSL
jgi:malonyl-CoA O-methyltransferase